MSKQDLNINLADYTAHLQPGKFEGESPATEYFYSQMLEGDGETIFSSAEEDITAELFYVNADEAEAFNLNIGEVFLLWEDSQGFVYGITYPTQAAAEAAFNASI